MTYSTMQQVINRYEKHEVNTAVIASELLRQGHANPETHLAGAEYIFHPCGGVDWYDLYDAIVRFPDERRMPHYVKTAIASAIRESSLEDDRILDVHFMTMCPRLRIHVNTFTSTLDNPKCGLNNCYFKTEETITHDELSFRSKAEIAIYDELKKRRLLFFPNAAAVLGGR